MQRLILIGVVFILIGFLLAFIGSVWTAVKGPGSSEKAEGKSNIKAGGVAFIGPLPIGWASDKKMFYVLLCFGLLIFVLWLVMQRVGGW